MLAAFSVAGCAVANAQAYDSANPVHCITVFGVAGAAANRGPLAEEMYARVLAIVQANGGETWLREIHPVTLQLAARWEASGDRVEIMKLFDECRDRQGDSANFKTNFPRR